MSKAHLSPEMLRRHGNPDLRLRLGSITFPVHKAYISACSSVLSNLAASFEGQDELCLHGNSSCDGNSEVSAAVQSVPDFERFLKQLYSHNAAIATESEALAMLALVDYYDCPAVLPAADAFLATALVSGRLAVCCYAAKAERVTVAGTEVGRITCTISEAKLKEYLETASRHKLRR